MSEGEGMSECHVAIKSEIMSESVGTAAGAGMGEGVGKGERTIIRVRL